MEAELRSRPLQQSGTKARLHCALPETEPARASLNANRFRNRPNHYLRLPSSRLVRVDCDAPSYAALDLGGRVTASYDITGSAQVGVADA